MPSLPPRRATAAPAAATRPRSPEPSLGELEAGLRIDERALETECRNQPELVYRVTKRLAQAISQRDALKQRQEEVEALVAAEIRDGGLAENPPRKVSETSIVSSLNLDQRVIDSRHACLQEKKRMGELEALKEAFIARGYALRDLIQLYLANYYSSSIDSSGSRVRNVNAQRVLEERGRQINR